MKKRQNAEIRKPEILKHFYQEIKKEGFEGASIAKVAKRMKIHPSLIIHYFTTKENMTQELVNFIVEKYSNLFKKMTIDTIDPQKRLIGLLEIYWSNAWIELSGIQVDFSVIAKSFRSKGIYKSIETLYGRYKNRMVREFRSFIDAGIIKIDDPERGADIILSMIEGYRHFKHFYVKKDSFERSRKDMINAALTILKYGFA